MCTDWQLSNANNNTVTVENWRAVESQMSLSIVLGTIVPPITIKSQSCDVDFQVVCSQMFVQYDMTSV